MKNKPRTSRSVAKKASFLLRKSPSKKVRSVAGDALGNRRRYSK